MHIPNDSNSLVNNHVRAIFEDSRGIFWVGTEGDGLHTMDRVNGTFERHLYDPKDPQKLSRPQIREDVGMSDHITFITEDTTGAIWIGTLGEDLTDTIQTQRRFLIMNPTKKEGGFADYRLHGGHYKTRDGVIWISDVLGMESFIQG